MFVREQNIDIMSPVTLLYDFSWQKIVSQEKLPGDQALFNDRAAIRNLSSVILEPCYFREVPSLTAFLGLKWNTLQSLDVIR